jgi:hypothetical protein
VSACDASSSKVEWDDRDAKQWHRFLPGRVHVGILLVCYNFVIILIFDDSSKAAIEMLVSVLAQEEKSLTVLGVRPGFVDTEMVAHLEDNLHVLGPDQHAYYRDTPRAQPFEAAEHIVRLLFDENTVSGITVDLYSVLNATS